ncbi:MAG: ABC transporter substrate-binding protein [Candidatus Limnocylindria bacterium]
MRSTVLRFGSVFAILVLVLAACGGQTGQSEEPSSSEPAASEPGSSEPVAGDPVEIRWFCCLGAGDDPAQVPTEEAVVEAFNEAHDDIELILEIVDYDQAFDVMSTEIAGGNAPDIVGPVGVSGAEAFHGQWLDLSDLIASSGYDTSQFSEGSVEFYNVGGEGQIGLPFAIYPSMLFYHRDMFDEADLEYPPHAYGDPYMLDGEEVEWDMDTLAELARRLTVDVNGNDATSPDFDAENVEQWGYEPQYQDLRAVGSYFGSGSLLAEDGTTAEVPEHWADAWKWMYDLTWGDAATMNEAQVDAPEIGGENAFNSGKVAMALTHLWYTCCIGDAGEDWDIAAVPSYNGTTTSNFNADTFRIWGDTEHPEEAFEVLTYLIGEASPELLQIYGGMPAIEADQDAFFTGLDETYPWDVDWQVVRDSVEFADNPSFEAFVPNYQEAFDAVIAFGSTLRSTDGLNVDEEIAAFTDQLQTIFDSAE